MIAGVMTSHPRHTTPTGLFTAAARALSMAAQQEGLTVPGFRCPPRVLGVDRTVRRGPGGIGGVVAVRIAGRPFTAAVADMIEGVVVINRLAPPEADAARSALWRTMLQFTLATAQSPGGAAPKVA